MKVIRRNAKVIRRSVKVELMAYSSAGRVVIYWSEGYDRVLKEEKALRDRDRKCLGVVTWWRFVTRTRPYMDQKCYERRNALVGEANKKRGCVATTGSLAYLDKFLASTSALSHRLAPWRPWPSGDFRYHPTFLPNFGLLQPAITPTKARLWLIMSARARMVHQNLTQRLFVHR